jgi:hypothetical protein
MCYYDVCLRLCVSSTHTSQYTLLHAHYSTLRAACSQLLLPAEYVYDRLPGDAVMLYRADHTIMILCCITITLCHY